MAIKVLLVEDEEKLAKFLQEYFENEGLQVTVASTLAEARQQVAASPPEVVLLDLVLPDGNGLDLCRELRAAGSNLPVLILTARVEEVDRVLGLELGADDYITKPFSPREVLARIRAVLRRSQGGGAEASEAPALLIRGDLKIDLARHEVWRGEERITLTPTEFKLLATLAAHPGWVYSRLQLVEVALGEYFPGYERVIDTHISNLRKKIGDNRQNPRYIVTVYGLGYKLREDAGEQG